MGLETETLGGSQGRNEPDSSVYSLSIKTNGGVDLGIRKVEIKMTSLAIGRNWIKNML